MVRMIDLRNMLRLAGAALLLAGCQSEAGTPVRQPQICDRNAAASLQGKMKVTDAEAMRLTGATIVRQIRPGDPVTMDFRRERITIETDRKTGRIARAYCG
jgi:hypothetical protein